MKRGGQTDTPLKNNPQKAHLIRVKFASQLDLKRNSSTLVFAYSFKLYDIFQTFMVENIWANVSKSDCKNYD